MTRRLQVIIAEDNESNVLMYQQRYHRFFSASGYNANFERYDCNAELIREKVSTGRYHVLITDVTFGDYNELGGLYLARSIKDKYPQTFIIGNSQADISITRMVGSSFDLFVPKDALASEEIISNPWFRSQFEALFRCNTELTIAEESLNSFSGKTRIEIQKLIQEALFTAHGFDESFDLAEAKLELLTKGYSDSRVFKLVSRSKDKRFSHIQSVVKISTAEKSKLELQNFNRYVRWTLPFEWRVDVLGSANGARYGVICYSFVDGSDEEDRIYDLERFLIDGDYHKIRYVIQKIMNLDARKWYQGGIYPKHDSITVFYIERYCTRYKVDFRTTQRVFERAAADEFGFMKVDGKMVIEPIKDRVTLPTAGVVSRKDVSCQTCIGHGDLHARNILVSDRQNGKVVFIDFQQTGRCHVFEDFILFETSVRLLFNREIGGFEFETEYQNEVALNNERVISDGGRFELIGEVRRRAFAHFVDEPKRNYIFGLLIFSMRLLRETKIVGDSKRRLMACIIACCKYFDEND